MIQLWGIIDDQQFVRSNVYVSQNFVGTPIDIKHGLTWLRLRNVGVDNPVNFEICSHPLLPWRKACSSHVAVEFLEALQVPKPSSTCSTATTSAGTAQLGEIFVGVGSWPHVGWTTSNEINSDHDFLQHNYPDIMTIYDISLASLIWGISPKTPLNFWEPSPMFASKKAFSGDSGGWGFSLGSWRNPL